MQYFINPDNIFFDWSILKNQHKNIHFISKDELIYRTINNISYYDHIEMSSFYNSTIISYGHDENENLKLGFHFVFPTIRKKINDTRGSFSINCETLPKIYLNNELIIEKLQQVSFNGFLKIYSYYKDIKITRIMFPAYDFPGFIIMYKIKSNNKNFHFKIDKSENYHQIINKNQTADCKNYYFNAKFYDEKSNKYINGININTDYLIFYHVISLTDIKIINIDLKKQFSKRNKFLKTINKKIEFKCDDKVLTLFFKLCKIRASESIFKTKNGYMHSPGGGNYYAALWTNDEIEYAAPFFGYLNYYYGNMATENCLNLYQKYMFTEKPLVTSIIAEGEDFWNGAKDRGDGAMYACGACKYLLIKNNLKLNEKYHQGIKWCIDYTWKQKNSFGVINSDSDELENRFESGRCNISTNSIFYSAINDYQKLYQDYSYNKDKNNLYEAIDKYFFANNIEGYKTYCYCHEEKKLRSHIFYPLISKILKRKNEVIETLLNSQLLKNGNFLTTSYCDTYWDRVTLMAIKGLYNADYNAYDLLINYCKNRLLNDHVPYPIEAFPEGNMAHLSAESALFCRSVIEGMLNIEIIDEKQFSIKPIFDIKQSFLSIRNIILCGINVSIYLKKIEDKYLLKIKANNFHKKFYITNNEKITIKF